jgi:branched-chain amino acid transport system permease protein
MGSPASPASAVDVALTVRVLGAAVVASLTSLPVAILAAIAFGIFDQTMLWLLDSSAIADGLIAAAVALVLLLKPAVRSRVEDERAATWRTAGEMKPTPSALRELAEVRRARRVAAAAVAGLLVGLPFFLSPLQTSVATTALIYAMVGWSLLVLSGWAGQISLGQFALAGGGAWVATIAAGRAGLPIVVALPAGVLAAGAIATAAGVPALKLRGQHLAVTTLAVALVASSLVFSPSELGSILPDSITRPSLLGIDLEDGRTFYFATLTVALAVAAAVAGLRRSRFGRALIAARDNEPAAQSFGIAPTRLRLGAFAVSGMIAGVAGTMFAYQQHGLKAASFSPDVGIALFLMTVIGGLGSLAGPAAGAAYVAVFQIAGASPLVQFAATGGGLLALLMIAPGGLAQIGFALRDTMLGRIARRHGITIGPGEDARARAPVAPNQGPSGGEAFTPRRYRIEPQWALHASGERDADD